MHVVGHIVTHAIDPDIDPIATPNDIDVVVPALRPWGLGFDPPVGEGLEKRGTNEREQGKYGPGRAVVVCGGGRKPDIAHFTST